MENLKDLLPIYYSRLFPFSEYYRWLSYGSDDLFSRREFSFTLNDDVYVRYQSFKNPKQLETEIKRLLPFKIDIGAIFNTTPNQNNKNCKAIERELVFDIDLTDYDEIRTCCSGADICSKCWKYMAIACKILDTALREDFGFNHILWVFSGRRGIHAWICDSSARSLDTSGRVAVAEYLQLITGGQFMKKKVNLNDKIHHSVQRALDIISPKFIDIFVEEQDMFGTPERIDKFLGLLPDDTSRNELKLILNQCNKNTDCWNEFVEYVNKQPQLNKKWKYRQLVQEVMIQYSYPRLDINVSKGINHLLKSPFCIHPKTGKVSIPINPKSIDKFDPFTTPTIHMLIDEVNAYDEKDKQATLDGEKIVAKKIKDYKKTSLNKSLHLFEEFLRSLQVARKIEKENQNNTMDF